ncbi:MAG TPA: hypothetical protein VHE35_07810, partial [Kofleriaceae bacterium]|nr:hypothetical protein [Kofleriaceae bacterium]
MNARDLRQKGYAIEVLLERGLERYRTGATNIALQLWDEALQIDPDEPRALTYIDYVRQNWDEVDGCVDPPVPDVSDLKPNYAAEPIAPPPPPVGNVLPSVSGSVDTAELEAKRKEMAALESRIAAARAEAERMEAAAQAARREALAASMAAREATEAAEAKEPDAIADAIPDAIHDAPTPRGTVEFRLGGVGGDGWGLAPESLARQPGALGGSRPWKAQPESVAVAAATDAAEALAAQMASELAEPAVELPAAVEAAAAPAAGEPAPTTERDQAPVAATAVVAEEGPPARGEVSVTDAAMAPAIGPVADEPPVMSAAADGLSPTAFSLDEQVTDPRMRLPSDAELDLLADEATKTYPRELAAAALATEMGDPLEAQLARTPTPVMPGRAPTPLMQRNILGAPGGLELQADADFERDLEEALGAAAAEMAAASPPPAPVTPSEGAAAPVAALEGAIDLVDEGDAVPTPMGADAFDDEQDIDLPDLDLPPPVAEPAAVAVAAPEGIAGAPVAPEAAAPEAAPYPPYVPPASAEAFADDRPTVWSPPPAAATQMMSMAERVEQALARDADPFGEDRVTTSWASPPASLIEASRDPEHPMHATPPVSAEAEAPAAEAERAEPAEPVAAEAAPPPVAEAAAAAPPAAAPAPAPASAPVGEPAPIAEPAPVAEPAKPQTPETPETPETYDEAADLAASLMADLLSEPSPAPRPPPAPPTPAADRSGPLARLTATLPEPEAEGSVFDRVTTLLAVEHEDLAPAASAEPVASPQPAAPATAPPPSPLGPPSTSPSASPLPRLSASMSAARVTVPMEAAAPPAPAFDLDEIELAPRSGVGLGAEPPIRLDQRELANTIDDVGPLERSMGRPQTAPMAAAVAPAAPPAEPADAEEMSLEDSDLLADDETGENPAVASARVPTLPLVAPSAEDEEALASSRASTRDLRQAA